MEREYSHPSAQPDESDIRRDLYIRQQIERKHGKGSRHQRFYHIHPVRIEPYTPALYVHQQDFPCLLTSSNDNISVATDDRNFLSLILRELNKYARIWVEDKMSIISVVGNMKSSCIETEARIMDALRNIPLKMISYGSDENDVSLVVKVTDKAEVLRLLDEKLLKKAS